MSNRLTRAELANRVAREGGAFEALRYGIRSRDIEDKKLAALWKRMEATYERLAPLAWEIDRTLKAA